MVGTIFAHYISRYNPNTYYFYAPTGATVTVYDGTANGINSTATSTISISAGQVGTYSQSVLGTVWFTSNNPVLATTTGTVGGPGDRTIMSPMQTVNYNRYLGVRIASVAAANVYGVANGMGYNTNGCVFHDTYPVMNVTTGDGAGGDAAQGLGPDYLCDTYSFGNSLSDYTITAPYPNTTVTTSYWNGSAWVVWDTHSLSGYQLIPQVVSRDGTQGAGVAATLVSGGAAFMASSSTGPWKWEGNKPFYLGLNDTADDELSMLGWTRRWLDNSNNNTATLINNPTYSSGNGGYLTFNGSNQYLTTSVATTAGQALTVIGWVYSTETTATYRNFFDSISANPMIWWNTSGQIEFDIAAYTTTTVYRNQWVHVALSKPSGSAAPSYYVNGSLVGTGGSYSVPAVTPTWLNRTAAQTWLGRVSKIQYYNAALTATQIAQNYNTTRTQLGL
jgi:hypothetical protein